MTYRILSIDGGGVYGATSISLIHRIAEEYPHFIDKTDLIAGTSVGGILGLFLANGETTSHIKEVFQESAKRIFQADPWRKAKAFAGLNSFYSHDGLLAVLNRKFGDRTLAQLQKNVVITAFQLYSNSTNHHWKAKIIHNFKGTDSDGSMRAVDVAAATASLPVVFPTYDSYVDGAMVENNPTMCAVAQTQDKRCLIEPRPQLSDIRVLSIGREKAKMFTNETNLDWGYLSWGRNLVDLVMDRDDRVVDYQARQLMGDNYCRISVLDKIGANPDAVDQIPKLYKLGETWDIDYVMDWVGKNWS
jgi:uncharacterized protein